MRYPLIFTRTIIVAFLSLGQCAHAFEPLPDKAPAPADNPQSEAKIALGKQLFFDPRLSLNGTLSCNSCHNVMTGGTDDRPVSIGEAGQKGGRNAPTVWNSAFHSVQFWDGRAATLKDQAKGPILNPVEMAMPSAEFTVARIKSIPGYVEQFKSVFGGNDPLTYDNIAKAIASYERTLITPNSAFDRYLKGEKNILSEQAKRGMKLVTDIGCTSCHTGINFNGPTSLPLGQGFYQKFPMFTNNPYVKKYKLDQDMGRFHVTEDAKDKHMWRVPTWRNIALTAPYFHNGSVPTLDEAVRVMASTQLNKKLNDSQVEDIVAFLNSLTGEFPEQTLPRLPVTTGNSPLSGN